MKKSDIIKVNRASGDDPSRAERSTPPFFENMTTT